MFDIAWTEMLIIAIVMIVVVGPKELPGMLRTFGRTTSKLRVMANDFRRQFDEALKEAELDDLKKLADDARKLNPAADIKKALNPLEAAGRDVRAGLDAAFNPPKAEPPKPVSSKPVSGTAEVTAAAPEPAVPAAARKAAASANAAAPAAKRAAAKAPPAAAKPAAAPKPAAAAAKPAAAKQPAKKTAAQKKTGGAAL